MKLIRIRGIRMAGLAEAKNRPKIKIGLTMFDLIVEIAGLVAVLAMWILIFAFYFKLPEIIPVHYDAAGAVNGLGKKSFILILAAIATIIFAGMTVLNWFPHRFSYMVKITETNAFTQYTLACRMVRCLKLAIIFICNFVIIQTIRIAEGKADSLPVWFIYVSIGLIFLITIYFIIKSFIYK